MIDYPAVLKKYDWLTKRNQNMIISADVDGILCALFMAHYFGWKVAGYYDGKALATRKGVHVSDCVFLDMEIFRRNIKSCGQHMLLYNKNDRPENWTEFNNSLNPNELRGFDCLHDFKTKYPLATIHLLIAILGKKININVRPSAVSILLYVDGTFKNLLNYPENCTDWFIYLGMKENNHILNPIFRMFAEKRLSVVIHRMQRLFRVFREIAGGKRGGDKIRIDQISDGKFSPAYVQRITSLIRFIVNETGWKYNIERWLFTNIEVHRMRKIIRTDVKSSNFNATVRSKPVSWAITANKRMELTLRNGLFGS